jgi:hypothetical protein
VVLVLSIVEGELDRPELVEWVEPAQRVEGFNPCPPQADSLLLSPEACFGVLIALVILIICGIMLSYRNITDDSTLNKTEVQNGGKAGSAS